MPIRLLHPFVVACNNIDYLFEGKPKISAFHHRLERFAEQEAATEFDFQIQNIEQDETIPQDDKTRQIEALEELKQDHINKIKGDGLEVFAEFLIKFMGTNPLIGVHNYQVEEAERDWGVDGFGIGNDGNPITVQVKFRHSGYELKWNAEHLGNFAAESFSTKYGVLPEPHFDSNLGEEVNNLLVITTGKGLHYSAQRQDGGPRIRILGYQGLSVLVNNNIMFWRSFQESWHASLQEVAS